MHKFVVVLRETVYYRYEIAAWDGEHAKRKAMERFFAAPSKVYEYGNDLSAHHVEPLEYSSLPKPV